ncbi:T9SS type A sorting domain-containing protein [Chryseobacterium gallinarum]|uniref:T9SS type A sorting domain-containing protein n=1 Tax=Chryseobacterium gallinarum TaxID=1324352 RepID=UPI0020256E00|nr:T9SS type A sorting domain-containing protein [Chryseobacterium gallinarum]MCL8537909.1 T9SS type A sorting domain-containing protein [Chryseobacterium gallinarum]
MKINLFERSLLIKIKILSVFLFLTNSMFFAQTRIYASAQNFQINGVCAACNVLNPENAVGSNEADFSSLQVPLGLFARIEQSVIFPNSKADYSKVAIGIGTGGVALSANVLGSISIETFNGNTTNDDYRMLNNSLIKLGANPTEGTIELTNSKPYDRIKITLHGGLLALNDQLRIYYAYQVQDSKAYANFQTSTKFDPVTGNGVVNPNFAVGNDEVNCSVLRIGRGQLGTVEQTLSFLFPVNNFLTKVVIGIGTDQPVLTPELLKKISIETMKGEVSNVDKKYISQNMLSIGLNPNEGIIEFTPTKSFDKVKISMESLNDIDQELKVFYIYHTSPSLFSCDPPPFNPIHHYPFNNNIEDAIGGLHLIPTDNSFIILEPDAICDKALRTVLHNRGTYNTASNENFINHSKTISFWARLPILPLSIEAYGILIANEEGTFSVFAADGRITEEFQTGQNNHFTITYSEDRPNNEAKLCLYKNGYAKLNEASCITTDILEIHNPNYNITGNLSITLPPASPDFSMDELLIYDRALSATEAEQLFLSYNKPQIPRKYYPISGVNNNTGLVEEKLKLSPNPTSGLITLAGNIEFNDSEISVIDTFGKEVYHSKFRYKTFELPATLSGGVYILNVKTKERKNYSQKIILRR